MNTLVMTGRLVSTPELKETENENKYSEIIIAVTRNYKNIYGEYETDLIPCTLWNRIAEKTAEYCKKGDFIGIKAQVQVKDKKLVIVVDKVTFLSSGKEIEE